MKQHLIKYRRILSLTAVIPYMLLLAFSILDVHSVNVLSGSFTVSEEAGKCSSRGYPYTDENSCPVHQAYSSVNQVIFQNTNTVIKPGDQSFIIYIPCLSDYNSIYLSGRNLRGPPFSA